MLNGTPMISTGMSIDTLGFVLTDFLTEIGIEVAFGIELPLFVIIIGLLLVALEAVVPGANFIIIGIAMVGAGAVGLAIPVLGSPLAQAGLVLLFGSLALLVYQELDLYGGKGQEQTSDSASLTGRTGYVTKRVTDTEGEIKLDSGGFDPHYRARTIGDPIAEGERAVVIDPGGGNVLTIQRVVTEE